MGSVAPKGLKSVTLTGGNHAAEHAVFEALIQRGADQRFSVLGFNCSHHGNSLAFTQFAHPNVAVGLGWPCIDYPRAASEEEQSLSAVKKALDAKRAQGNPVGAVIIEPTNSGRGHSVSVSFVEQLKRLAHDYEAALILDETNSGCGASGKGFW